VLPASRTPMDETLERCILINRDSDDVQKNLTRLQGVFNNPKLLNTVFNL